VATGAPPPVEPVQTYEAPAPIITQGPVTVAPPQYVERAYAPPPVEPVQAATLATPVYAAPQQVEVREVIKEVPVVHVQTVERIQEVPQIEVREVIREVPTVQVEEVIKQVIVPQYQEVIKHVPVPQVQTVEKIVEVPQVRVTRRDVQVPQIQTVEVIKQVIRQEIQEVIREVPKIEVQTVEKIVEVPQVQIQERVVEVVEHQVEEVINQVPVLVVQEVVRHVPKIQVQKVEKIISTPQVQTVERVVEIPQIQCVYLPAEEPQIDMTAPTDVAFSNSVMVGATMRDLPGGGPPQVVQTEQGPMLMEPVATGMPGAPVTMAYEPTMAGPWNQDDTFRLCDDSEIQQYMGRTHVYPKAQYTSVAKAVDDLNRLPGGGQDSWVVVFSQSHDCWYVMYKAGCKEVALQHFGL
jgi:hypothetical protein